MFDVERAVRPTWRVLYAFGVDREITQLLRNTRQRSQDGAASSDLANLLTMLWAVITQFSTVPLAKIPVGDAGAQIVQLLSCSAIIACVGFMCDAITSIIRARVRHGLAW